MKLLAPAKINLGLAVGNKRADGYHDLETILVPISLYDEIRLRAVRAAGNCRIRLELIPHPDSFRTDVPSGEANICIRAARLLLDATGNRNSVVIGLKKCIPVAAGLGGGSSDAAAVLTGLNRLLGNPLNRYQLSRLALQLGSDVPFFLRPSACVALGRGERLYPVKLPKFSLVLYIPDFPVATAWAYSALDRLRQKEPVRLTAARFSRRIALNRLQAGDYATLGTVLTNDFEAVVFRTHPELLSIKRTMLKAGAAAALLSGSGGCLYALVQPEQLNAVAAALAAKGGRVFQAETLTQLPVLGRRPTGRTQDFGSWKEGSNPSAPAEPASRSHLVS